MKEITRVHVAKMPYSIEIEAKKALAAYLGDIERVMHADVEVMQEIEARVVELLAARGVRADGVITASDVAAVRQHMGEPSDFSEDGSAPAPEAAAEQTPTKRLMRDTDQAWLGGVCAGIAVYFGVRPMWIRLLAIVLLLITLGTSLVAYVLLWVVLPPAQTAAEKLQMRGEAVTLAALKETTAGQSVARGVNAAAKAIRFVLGSMLLLGTLGALIALLIGSAMGISVVMSLQGFMAQPWAWGLLLSLMIGGVAAVWLGTTLTYSAFSWTLKKPMIAGMITALVVGAICISTTTIFAMRTASELARDEQRLTRVVTLPLPEGMQGVRTVEDRTLHTTVQLGYEPSGDVRAELRYVAVDNVPAPRVTLTREGSRLVVHSEGGERQCHILLDFTTGTCYGALPKVTIYGKGLAIDYGRATRY
ncbi:MAG: PspC domain-containing protein [Candidatus Saccharibacteria bacterium]|nr:PspC domain-containing protein [Candidatus Saccharibacteria bacterium]